MISRSAFDGDDSSETRILLYCVLQQGLFGTDGYQSDPSLGPHAERPMFMYTNENQSHFLTSRQHDAFPGDHDG